MESSDPELVSNGVSNSNWGYGTDNFHGFYEPSHIWTVLLSVVSFAGTYLLCIYSTGDVDGVASVPARRGAPDED